MKLFFGEFKPNYDRYHFPYQVWLLKEEGDRVEKIYENGFLPIRSVPHVYYLSRGVRINLGDFQLSSENRRILRKTENIEANIIPLSQFNYSPEVQKMCKDYAQQKFGPGIFPVSAVRNVFNNDTYNQIMVFKDKTSQKEVGYAVCFVSDEILQYAHSFYDLSYLSQNLGARMMLEAVVWSKDNHKKHIYLGTCYDRQALYKTEFKGVAFFNGFTWSENLLELKELIERETDEYVFRDKKFVCGFHGNLAELMSKHGVRVNF